MGLFGVKTAIFSSRGALPRTPLGARPPDPRVRPQRPQNLELGYRQKSPLPVRPSKKGRFIDAVLCPQRGATLVINQSHAGNKLPTFLSDG